MSAYDAFTFVFGIKKSHVDAHPIVRLSVDRIRIIRGGLEAGPKSGLIVSCKQHLTPPVASNRFVDAERAFNSFLEVVIREGILSQFVKGS